MGVDQMTRIRHLTAVLGPTNTGKTHLAIERMLGHATGMIGLPLRLLAREVYDRVAARVGADMVALITGEEKIKPDNPAYWVCTVEAMPQDVSVDFLAIDEIQLAADLERGHVFTDRLLHARGEMETLVLGAATMREAIADLIPGANFISRPRLSKLTYAGQKKITRLPPRSAIVAFSAADVYQIAELIRRQRGGAAVVLGALSPRTRNAQVALYQSGDVDFLVATDAIGMGLNLDVDHVAFSSVRKFDGQKFRDLMPAELAQIAGRAGRHMNDGTFGVTGDAEPFEQELVDRLEDHAFDAIKTLQWRARDLDFSSIDALRDSLRVLPAQIGQHRLSRTRGSEDSEALENVSRDADVVRLASAASAVETLWDACQIPDYRKISAQSHADLVASVFKDLMGPTRRIDNDWFARQIALCDRTDGDIDTLANRLSHIRTWTFVANRSDWLQDPGYWQGRTREVEDSLSDALHVCLTQRFVDARASALMKGMKDNQQLNAEIGEDGSIHVESHYVGSLKGFRYFPDAQADGLEGKTTRNAAGQVLSKEMSMRARRVVAAKNDAFTLARNGRIFWRNDEIAKLEATDDPLKPQASLIADDTLQGADRERVLLRVQGWVSEIISERLKPLVDISKAEDIDGLARGIAFRLVGNVGGLKRDTVASEMKELDQGARARLRRYGVRFGAFNIFFPVLLKPAAADLLLTLWCLRYGKDHGLDPAAPPQAPRAGLTSAKIDPSIPEAFYRAYGFHVCGPRAVRIDMLERLADLIRPLLAWRAKHEADTPPKGATGDGGFVVIPEMMSILGCSPDDLGNVLNTLGFRSERRAAPKPVQPAEPTPAMAQSAATSEMSELAASDVDIAPSAGGDVAAALLPDGTPDMAATEDRRDVITTDTRSETTLEDNLDVPAVEAVGPEAMTASGDVEADAVAQSAMTDVVILPLPEASATAVVAAPQSYGAPDVPDTADAAVAPHASEGADAEVPAAQQEPETIEVWRPRRRHEGNDHRRNRRRGGEYRPARADSGQADAGPTDAAPAGEKIEDALEDAGRFRRDGGGRGDGSKRGDRKDNRPAQNDRDGGRAGRGRPRPEKGGREDHRRGLTVHSSAPARSKGIDPDSPFAALSALKDNLGKRPTDG